jgi:hypothetical protein
MTATATKKERHLNVSQPTNGVYALCITQGKEKTGYYVRQIDADFGLAFSFTKFETDQEEGTPSEYAVNVDERGNDHTCECLGHIRWGHRHPCRHTRTHPLGSSPSVPVTLPPGPCRERSGVHPSGKIVAPAPSPE